MIVEIHTAFSLAFQYWFWVKNQTFPYHVNNIFQLIGYFLHFRIHHYCIVAQKRELYAVMIDVHLTCDPVLFYIINLVFVTCFFLRTQMSYLLLILMARFVFCIIWKSQNSDSHYFMVNFGWSTTYTCTPNICDLSPNSLAVSQPIVTKLDMENLGWCNRSGSLHAPHILSRPTLSVDSCW